MKIKLTLALLFLSILLFSQPFEGYLVYQNNCKSSDPNWKQGYCDLITDSLQVYYFKEGDYRYNVANAEKWTLFKKNENKIYNKAKKQEVVTWADQSEVSEFDLDIVDIQLNKKAATILGYECDELILTGKNSIQKYYFNAITGIDPTLLENHKKGHLGKIISLTKAIPLKTVFILEQQNLELESVAIKIKKTTLSKALFEVPKNLKIIDAN